MSEPTFYRLNESIARQPFWRGAVDDMLDDGVLVPVEPCEHGNAFRHIIFDSIWEGSMGIHYEWCPGVESGGDEDEH